MLKAQYETRGPVPQDVIHPVEFEEPTLESGQVLVEVLAAPINPSDVLTLTGEYGQLPPLPAVGGNEGVGRILKLGPDVEDADIGRVVLLPIGCGSWATHIVADAKHLVPLPDKADPQQLAMMSINPPTASLMLSEFVKLERGEWIIQNAANSAVGLYIAQLAKLRNYKTVNVVRREDAVEVVREAGGDVVLVDGDDLPARVKEATDGAKIRLGIDAVAGKAIGRLAECLTRGGTLVNYGRMSGEPCVIQPGAFVFRDMTLRGFWLANWFAQAPKPKQVAVFGEIARLIAEGKLHAPVQATFEVREIKKAVAAAAASGRSGKILIVPGRV